VTTSLRWRLFGYLALAAMVSTTLTVAVVAVLIGHRASAQNQRTLDRQAEALLSVLPSRGPTTRVYARAPGRIGGVRALARARADRVLAAVPASGDHDGTITVAGRRLRFSERTDERSRLILVRPAQLAPGDDQSFVLGLVLAGLGGVIVAALLALLLARRLVRPIGDLAAASRRLPEERGAVEVAVRGPQELAELATTFNAMSRALAAAREGQRSFLLSVSHELKTPLTAILGHAEGLQDGAVDPRAAGDVIAAETARLERLVLDLLNLARLDRRDFAVACRQVDLATVADQAHARFESPAHELGIDLITTNARTDPVVGDHDRVLQIASNLIENALRITPRDGTVTIDARERSLSVTDTGPGLGPHDIPHAFERFYLHSRQSSDRRTGSGLGLAIVKELADAMSATTNVESRLGVGTTFTVTLPPAPH